jgi:hypothetical protein
MTSKELHALLAGLNIGDFASILGLVVSVCGFYFTLLAVKRSRAAAEFAKEATLKVREDIRRYDVVADLTSALNIMSEVKRLHRRKAWEVLPDRYSALRGALISIRSSSPELSEAHQAALQGAMQHFTSIEKQVEGYLSANAPQIDIVRLNTTVSRQIDNLQEILVNVRNGIGK